MATTLRPLAELGALPDDALVFGPEVAALLAISVTTFHLRRKHRELPIHEVSPRLDRRPRYRLGDVRAWVRGASAWSTRHRPPAGRGPRAPASPVRQIA